MQTKKDPRGSLACKCGALILLIAAAAGAALCSAAVVLLSCGYGTAESFQEDILCREAMESAMSRAGWYVLSDFDEGGYYMLSRYGGFSAQVYNGDPLPENLLGAYGELPEEILCQMSTDQFIWRDEAYTIVGYLSRDIPAGTNFALRRQMYGALRTMSFGGAMVLAALLWTAAAAALIFLLSAAGHRESREGIVLNWQDRIPLDAYLLCAGTAAAITASIAFDAHGMPMALEITVCGLGMLALGAVALAVLLTLATRLKKGRWWRNTVCWWLLRFCRRLWRGCWRAVKEFTAILSLTWRSVLAVGLVLYLQIFLFVPATYSDGAFFLLLLFVLDGALVLGAAVITHQLQKIRDMGRALAAGELDTKIDTRRMFQDIRAHAEDLNAIGDGMTRAVEQRLRSERLKTELITNVSHDIKTPLTSIVNYVDLLKTQELPPAAAEYLTVLDRQANRLRKLTEDLVEASKASTGNIAVRLEPIVVNEIVHQAVGDYDERLAAGRLEVIVNTYEGSLQAVADGRLLWRVLDNLLGNVCKYAMAGTRVYIDLMERDGRVVLSIKNVSRDQLNVSAEELMERFVRGDASRHTEGSGLGLNIARSLIDLMGGTFELSVDGDLFKAHLTLPAVEASASTASVPVLTEPELIARQKSRLAALTEEITARLKGG